MRGIPRKRSDELERDLKRAVPQAGEDFVASLASDVTPPQRPRRSRVAFASALTVIVVGSLASFGGIGYAAENVSSAATAAKNAVAKTTSAEDQYGETKAVTSSTPSNTQVAGATAEAPAQSTLPFTGLSLVGTLVIGAALVGVGIALRRREQKE